MTQYIYDYGNAEGIGRELLGGKGLGLVEMTRIGIPVPSGFTVTTSACVHYIDSGGSFPTGLETQLVEAIARLEKTTGKFSGGLRPPDWCITRGGGPEDMG